VAESVIKPLATTLDSMVMAELVIKVGGRLFRSRIFTIGERHFDAGATK